MKTPNFALIVLLLFPGISHGDVPKNPRIITPTNRADHLLPFLSPTNHFNMERLKSSIEELEKRGERINDVMESPELFLENTKKEIAMFRGATNMMKFSYPYLGKLVTLIIINPSVSAEDPKVVNGRFYFLYPKEWHVTGSYFTCREPAALPETGGILFAFEDAFYTWYLEFEKPFVDVTPEEKKKMVAEFLKLTAAPAEEIRLDPGTTAPIWIADCSDDVPDEKK